MTLPEGWRHTGVPGWAAMTSNSWYRETLAAATDIERHRVTAEIVGIDFEAVLEKAKRVSRTSGLPWETVFRRVWDRALLEACS